MRIHTASGSGPLEPGACYLAEDGEEFLRAYGISRIGAGDAGAASFLPREGAPGPEALLEAWNGWLAGLYASCLGPAFCRAHAAVAKLELEILISADTEVDAVLSEEARERSLEAGRAFREGRESLRHSPAWRKFHEALEAGRTPGHVVTLFALQAGLYHVSGLSALLAYAIYEWSVGVAASGRRSDAESLGGEPERGAAEWARTLIFEGRSLEESLRVSS